jgi:hypothetical protein
MKKQVIKKVTKKAAKKLKAVAPKKVQKAQAVKLSKQDPDYYKKIGAISAAKRKLNSTYFSDMAKKSHPVNNPEADREGYFGGRKPKTDTPTE